MSIVCLVDKGSIQMLTYDVKYDMFILTFHSGQIGASMEKARMLCKHPSLFIFEQLTFGGTVIGIQLVY